MTMTGEQQYIKLCNRIATEGTYSINQRTGEGTVAVINADFEYDTTTGALPVLTTREVNWKSAIAEMVGYLRGYQNAKSFDILGCKTWWANANENEAWLKNPNRLCDGDMGRCYGVQGRTWRRPDGLHVDQYENIVNKLKDGIDDRNLIMTFNNPGEADKACLNACMHTHTFSLVDGVLHLTSYQRSADMALGVVFNMIQAVFLLRITARITGHNPGMVYHKMVNCHIYNNHLAPLMYTQVKRTQYDEPKFIISSEIKSLNDLENKKNIMDCFSLEYYTSHPEIFYKMAV